MRSIFPTTIDGDLLKFVRLSNGFLMVDGAKPLRVGDVCSSEARIASATNTDAGNIVKVKGHVYRAGTPVSEVVSAFLYRGRFTGYECVRRHTRPRSTKTICQGRIGGLSAG